MNADDRLTRTLKVLASAALGVALLAVVLAVLHRIMAVVIVVGGALFFAYLIYPLVRRFSRRLPRWLAILCVYAIVAVVLACIVAFVGPKLGSEARSLAQNSPQILQHAQDWILSANYAIVAAIPIEQRESAIKVVDAAVAALQKNAGVIAGQALSIVLSVASVMTAFVIIPVLAFYILMDTQRIRTGLMRLVPEAHRTMALTVLADVDAVLGGFIRGQIIVCACVAVLVTLMLLVMHVDYALLIGVFAGVVDIIPYLGALAGAIPAVLIALFTHGPGWALLVAAGFVLVYQAEGHIIAPNVVGQRVGLTPLMVILAILIGAELGGILGLFIAVPVAGIINAVAARFLPAAPIEEPTDVVVTKEKRT